MAKYLKKKPKKRRLVILLIVLLLVIAVCIGVIIYELNKWMPGDAMDYDAFHSPALSTQEQKTPTPYRPGPAPTAEDGTPVVSEAVELNENPIRFDDLRAVSDDIYAWVYVPGTEVDYPVLQSKADVDDNFYLHRNIYGEYEYQGSVYSQKMNAKDFSDRVTVIYGHNMLNNSMFSTLIDFLDETFFDEHPYFYIYTPGHILTYQIVSAHQYDKRHILNSFDFSDDEDFQGWLDMIQNPKTFRAHVRSGIELTLDSRIVTLSTCINHGTNRYLIQGVLISDEPTK